MSKEFYKKYFVFWISLLFIAIVFLVGFSIGIKYENATQEPKIIEKEIEKETIKYVEKSKTKTKDFLIHLNKNVDPQLAIIIADSIDKASSKYRLPRKLVCSIIRKESIINPFAKSKAGAVGLMQIMPNIHKEKYNGRNLWHVDVNIDVGCEIFKEYLDKEHGNMEKTFHRYLSKNATKDQVKNYISDIYEYWAKLEMFDYLSIAEREENKEENINGKEIENGKRKENEENNENKSNDEKSSNS